MTPLRTLGMTWLVLAACVTAGCGGGGGSGAPAAPAAPPPSSGTYAWALKAEGPTASLKYGLSLVHPASSSVEYVIEPASANVTDAKVVASGSVDVASQRASSLQPYALVYIVGGDVRRVPLQANGQAPAARVQRAGATSACKFILDANDYAQPEASRYIVSTAGPDGLCGTADDGTAELRLDASLGLVISPLGANPPLAALRDPATLKPRSWITARTLTPFDGSPAVTLRDASVNAPPIDRVVGSSYRAAVVESSTGVSYIDFPGGAVFKETALTALSGTGWQSIGYDAGSHYVYRTDSSRSGTWQVARISRQSPAATLLASGSGQIAFASLGRNVLYLTVFGSTANQLLALAKAAPGNPQVLESLGTDSLSSVSTSNAGVHQLWRVTGVGSASIAYTIEMIDESFAKQYTAAGGWPLGQPDAMVIDFNASENRSLFLLATGYASSRAFSGAALVSYDASAQSVTTVGNFPGAATYGSDVVFANVASGPSPVGAGFVARSSGGVVQSAGARVFSFQAGSAGSLSFASSQQ